MRQLSLLAFTVLLGASVWASFADEGHAHGTDAKQSNSGMMHGKHGQDMHGHGKEDTHHQHDDWADPPKAYGGKVSNVWADADAIERGEEIYQKQCASCHGIDGKGTGPLAQALSHPPADLTNNFHTSPGNGDAYLFWRVSEGGQVEPFKSQGSRMPAFKDVLSESERWDVLSYIHTFFHQGLMEWQQSGADKKNAGSNGIDS